MARKGSGLVLWWIVSILILIAMVPREVWIGVGVTGVIALAVYGYAKWQAGKAQPDARNGLKSNVIADTYEPTLAELVSSQPKRRNPSPPHTTSPAITPPAVPAPNQRASDPEFHSARLGSQAVAERTFAIPKPFDGFGDARWVPPGETVKIAGLDLPGGMLYVGARLKAANGSAEPAL